MPANSDRKMISFYVDGNIKDRLPDLMQYVGAKTFQQLLEGMVLELLADMDKDKAA